MSMCIECDAGAALASSEGGQLHGSQTRVLRIVIGVNLALFTVQLPIGIAASSTALIADGFDMLGDALMYSLSLYVVTRGALWKARCAATSGVAMLAFAVLVVIQGIHKAMNPEVPDFMLLEAGALAALAGNALCFRLLARHRGDDLSMGSAWLCSRNDLVANVLIIVAGLAGHAMDSQVPDLAVGLAIAGLFARSGLAVMGDAWHSTRESMPPVANVRTAAPPSRRQFTGP